MSPLPTPEERPYLAAIDRTQRGLGRYELTSFYATPNAISEFSKDVIDYFHLPSFTTSPPIPEEKWTGKTPKVDAIIGLDALGFPLAGALSVLTGIPVILARKGGKLALPIEEIASTGEFGDYAVARVGMKSLEIRRDLLTVGMGVLLVDEWIDSGTQMTSLCDLLESLDVKIVGIASLNLREGRHPGGDRLWERYEVFASARTPLGARARWEGVRGEGL